MSYYGAPPPPPPPAAGPAITPWYRKPGPLFLLGLLIAAAIAVPVLLVVLGGDDDGQAGSTSTSAGLTTTTGGSTTLAEETTTTAAQTTTSGAVTTTTAAATTTTAAATTTSGATTTTSGGTLTLDYSLEATYADRQELSAGFTPQPWEYSPCSSGGFPNEPWVDVSSVDPTCRGYANNAPDFDIRWSGSSSLLCFYFVANEADGDTTLIVNTPMSEWVCDDDSGEMYNPVVRIDNPPAGGYDIWLGSYADGVNVSGVFYVTDDPSLCPAP